LSCEGSVAELINKGDGGKVGSRDEASLCNGKRNAICVKYGRNIGNSNRKGDNV